MSIVNGKGLNPKWNHLMLDLESLGKRPGYIVTEIAAVPFNWNDKNQRKEDAFYVKINKQSSIDTGLKIDMDTLIWWSKQDPLVYKTMMDEEGSVKLGEALYKLQEYIQNLYPNQLQIWGNSNRFDLGLIEALYTSVKKEVPWNFMMERDVRTLISLYPNIKDNHKFIGFKHDPIVDCLNQIDYLIETKNRIKIII